MTPITAAVATTKSRSEGRACGAFGSPRSLSAAVALTLVLAGCRARPAPASTRAEPPVPAAPADLAATLSVPNLAALYASARALGGARTSSLPQSPELALAAGVGLPVQAASALVLDQPAAGALLVAESGAASAVFACRVRSGRELVLALSGGAAPARHANVDAASGLTTLVGSDGSAFGVVGDWLVLASTTDALASAGPYVARVLGARPAAADALRVDVPAAAFPRLVKLLGARWQTLRASLASLAASARADAGRPADFADPKTILGFSDELVKRLVARVAASRAATFTLALPPARAELALDLEPLPGSAAEVELQKLVTGSFEPLLALPRATVLGVLSRAASPSGGSDEPAASGALSNMLSAGLPAKNDRSLEATLALAARGLGETTSVGLLPDETAVVESGVADSAALEQAEKGLVTAVNTPELRAPLAAFLGSGLVREHTERVPGLDTPVHRIAFPARAGATAPELAWSVRDRALLAAFGAKGAAALATLATTPSSATLAAEPELAAAATRRTSAAFAVAANLGGLAGVPAYALLACGKHEGAARFELELNAAAVGFLGRLVP